MAKILPELRPLDPAEAVARVRKETKPSVRAIEKSGVATRADAKGQTIILTLTRSEALALDGPRKLQLGPATSCTRP